ncbi:MAG: restriction endonuclease subunit S [Candidatus Thiodiazotropha lotti]
MNETWPIVATEDIASKERNAIVGGPFGSNLVSGDYADCGVPVIRGQNMGRRWIGGDFVFVSLEKAESLSANHCRPGDIVFTQRGTLGQVSLVPNKPFGRYVVSQSQMKLTVDRDIADPIFYYYVFSSPQLVGYVKHNAIQVGVPHTNLGHLKETPIPLPPLEVQESIAEILSSLDEKIELNRKQNRTLEAIAQALFKRWFVEFEFPDENGRPYKSSGGAMQPSELGEIPVGWEVKPLDQIADYLNGLALQKFPPDGDEYLPVIKIREMKQGVTANSDKASTKLDPKHIVDDGDVLFSWSGSLEVDIWCHGKGALNQHLFKVTSEDYPKWFYYLWTKYHLRSFQAVAADKATTMGHIQRGHLSDALTVCPPDEMLPVLSGTFEPLIDKVIACRIESRTLARLRDTLLPKLMFGELRVA